jgi:hypothetical protein
LVYTTSIPKLKASSRLNEQPHTLGGVNRY